MKNLKNIFLGIVLLILTQNIFSAEDTLKIISPTYFNEQSKIYEDIHYLENEILSFEFCSIEKPEIIEFNLDCNFGSNSKSLEVIKKSDENTNCYFSNYNVEDFTCNEFSLNIDYQINNKNKKIKRTFTKQKESKLINHVLSEDVLNLDGEELSYYLIISNALESKDSKQSIEAYDRLKNLRDNTNKCWPDSSCNLLETSQILRNLKIAEYEKTTRLLEDGKTYIEKNTIDNENSPLQFLITLDHAFNSTEEINCDLTVDDENPKTYNFDDNESIIQNKYASNTINFVCDKTVDEIEFTLYNLDGQIQELEDYENTNSFSYSIKDFACVSLSSTCDFETNINSLITYSTDLNEYNQILIYTDSNKIESDTEEYINSDDIIEDTGKYIYFKPNENFENYLKYNQNNDGSWGSNSRYDRIIESAWATLGLNQIYKNSEHVNDGKSWIYFNEPEDGWESIKKNTLAYLAIQEQIKPYIKINSKNKISKTTFFTIENPTIFKLKNIKILFDEETKKILYYTESLGDLDGQEKIKFNITVDKTFFGSQTGNMKVTGINGKNNELTLLEMPINIEGPSTFDLIIKNNYSSTDDDPFVNIELTKNVNTFEATCEYFNPLTEKDELITITQNSKYFSIPNPQLISKNFKTNIKCSFEENKFEIQIESKVFVALPSFEIEEEKIIIDNEKDFSIKIHNTAQDKETVSMEITGNYKDLIVPVEVSKIIARDDTRELFFSIANIKVLKSLQGLGTGEILIRGEYGYSKKIPIELNFPIEEESDSNILYIIIGILILSFIGLVIYRAAKIRKENIQEEQKQQKNPQNHDDEYDYDEEISFE